MKTNKEHRKSELGNLTWPPLQRRLASRGRIVMVTVEGSGNRFCVAQLNMEGWLCPALIRYLSLSTEAVIHPNEESNASRWIVVRVADEEAAPYEHSA